MGTSRRLDVALVAAVSLSLPLAGLTGAGAVATPVARAAISADPVEIRLAVQHVGAAAAKPWTTAQCQSLFQFSCYDAHQIETAYDLPALYARGITGRGQTIVIVDPFGSPTIKHDLAVFDRTYAIPAPPALTIIAPAGPIAPYVLDDDHEGWAGETSLDVEYAHAIAPGARILLVETPTAEDEGTSGFPAIVKAEKYVIDHHLGSVISQSFAATEQTFPSKASLLALRGAYVDAAAQHVTVVSGSGDDGVTDFRSNSVDLYTAPVSAWPATDPLVTAVGATQLHLNAAGHRTAADTVWNDTYRAATEAFFGPRSGLAPFAGSGGTSVIFARPAYQNSVASVVGAHRGVPDISMSGACDGSVNVFQSFPGQPPGWYPTCGTSESTPLFAGIVALADQVAKRPLGLINPTLYALSAAKAKGIVDVLHGTNTVSFIQHGKHTKVTGFAAKPGYDLASGVGTIDAATFVPELAAAG